MKKKTQKKAFKKTLSELLFRKKLSKMYRVSLFPKKTFTVVLFKFLLKLQQFFLKIIQKLAKLKTLTQASAALCDWRANFSKKNYLRAAH